MVRKSAPTKKSRHLAIAAACTFALALGVVVPALATSQAGPLYVYDSADAYAIEGYTTANNGIGVEGYAALASATGVTGVLGYTLSQFSTGVTGYSDGTGVSYGVYGYSKNGNGLYGKSLSSSAASIYGLNANNGTAIYGYSNGLGLYGVSQLTNGVVGTTQTTDNNQTGNHYAGVLGTDNSTVGLHYGVAGTTTGTNGGYGVYGLSSGSGQGAGIGVVGLSNGLGSGISGTSAAGNGVDGFAGNGGNANGVAGTSGAASASAGVFGTTSVGYGVYGYATGGGGWALAGRASGANGYGVYASSNHATATALRVDAFLGKPITVNAGGGADIMSLDATGNMILKGTLTQNGVPLSVVRNPQGVARVAYASQQAQPTIEDVGEAQMTSGRAYVRLDPAFAEMLEHGASYHVFITPEGPTATPLYVTEKSPQGFAVREISNHANMAFEYRIVARPASERGYARLALYHESLAAAPHDKGYLEKMNGVRANRAAAPNREMLTRGVTLGRLPQRLKTPFVPKPSQRR